MTSHVRGWRVAYASVVVIFLVTTTRYYHPGVGLTAFLGFTTDGDDYEIPAVRSAPHFEPEGAGGYDGIYYAQMAVDPLLRDPAIDHALDDPAYRARRILCSWIGYAAGLGRPAWILQAYALENVVCWLLLAWVLSWSLPPSTGRMFALWAGCLLSDGLLAAVRNALPDGPSLLLIALALAALERKRWWLAAVVLGAAGLARETNLFALAALGVLVWRFRRPWIKLTGGVLIGVAPFLVWLDYLRSIYRSSVWGTRGQITVPLSGLWWKIGDALGGLRHGGTAQQWATLAAVLGLLVQIGYFLAVAPRRWRDPWAVVAAMFALLALTIHQVVWDGQPGAFTRVLLPLSVGVNILLARASRPAWWLIAGANLSVLSGVLAYGFGP